MKWGPVFPNYNGTIQSYQDLKFMYEFEMRIQSRNYFQIYGRNLKVNDKILVRDQKGHWIEKTISFIGKVEDTVAFSEEKDLPNHDLRIRVLPNVHAVIPMLSSVRPCGNPFDTLTESNKSNKVKVYDDCWLSDV